MTELNKKISNIYPEFNGLLYNPHKNPPYILQNDSNGNGAYIKIWSYFKPRPTQEELDNEAGNNAGSGQNPTVANKR